MEEKEEKKLKINLSTAICLGIIFILVVALIGLSFYIVRTKNIMEEMKRNFDVNSLVVPNENIVQ